MESSPEEITGRSNARAKIENRKTIHLKVGHRQGILNLLSSLSGRDAAGRDHSRLAEADIEQARQLLMTSLDSYRNAGVTSRVIECQLRMADIERVAGDRRSAQRCIREALTLAHATSNLFWLAHLFCLQAALETKPGAAAVQLLGAADGLMESMGGVWTPRERRMQQPVRSTAIAARGESAFERSLAAGCSLSWQQAVELALSRSAR